MLQNAKHKRQKLNTTKAQLSSFTHNDSELFTLVSNDVIKPTVQNMSQFRVHKWHRWLNDNTNNRWKHSEKERRKSTCKKWRMRRERVRFRECDQACCDLAKKTTLLVMWTKSSGRTQAQRHDAETECISYWPWFYTCTTYSIWVYCNMLFI